MFSIGAVVMDSPCLSHSLRHLYQEAHSRRRFCAVLPPVAVCVRVPRARVNMASFGATVIAMGKRDYATIRSSHWPTIPIRIKHLFIHNEVKNSLNTPPQSIPALRKKKESVIRKPKGENKNGSKKPTHSSCPNQSIVTLYTPGGRQNSGRSRRGLRMEYQKGES